MVIGMNIAVIFCCYNRKAMTRRCLTQLYAQIAEFQEDTFQIYVCDDNSNDGTVEMIEKEFPQVCLLKSGGNLFWCKSMYVAMHRAQENRYDLYIMINDDVDFNDHALRIMLDSYREAGKGSGIVGTVKAVSEEVCTYGGRGAEGNLIEPDGKIKECQWANWNCFLVDGMVIEKIGMIDGKYQHAWGDFDYSFRMKRVGLKIYVAVDYVGRCDINGSAGSYKDSKLDRRTRLKKLFSPKGMPFYSYMRYHMRIFGRAGLFEYLYGYLSLIGYILLGKEIE